MSSPSLPSDAAPKNSPPTSRPASPSPSRTGFRTLARVGTAIRRNSTSLFQTRQSVSRSASKSSLKVEASQSPPLEAAHAPDTVPESPAREEAALEAENNERLPVGPSPLSQEAKPTPEATPAPQAAAVLTAEPEPIKQAPEAAQPAASSSTPAASLPEPEASIPAQPVSQPAPQPSVPPITQPATQPVAQRTVPPDTQSAIPPVAQPTSQAASVVQPGAQMVASPEPVTSPIPIGSPVQYYVPTPSTQPIGQAGAQHYMQPVVQILVQPTVQQAPQAPAQPPAVVSPSTVPPAQINPIEPPASRDNFLAGVQPAVPIEERGPDYFAWNNIPITSMRKASSSSIATRQPSQEATLVAPATSDGAPLKAKQIHDALGASSKKSSMEIPKIPSQEQLTASPKQMPTTLAKQASQEQLVASPKQSVVSLSRRSSTREQVPATPPPVPHELSPKPSKSSIASSYGQVVNVTSGGRRFSVSIDPNAEPVRGRSRSRSSIRVSFDDPYTDPFADPPASNEMTIPKTALSPIYSIDTPMVERVEEIVNMPEAVPAKPEYQPISEEPDNELHEATPAPISMPLPALSEVAKTSTIRQQPSAYSIGESSGIVDVAPHETDERLPLLRRMPVPDVSQAIGGSSSAEFPAAGASSTNGIPWPSVQKSFTSQGWSQHVLPDSTIYYYHPDLRVATDIDLRNDKKAETVMLYLNSKGRAGPPLPPAGWELWLRDAGRGRYDFTPLRGFINHDERILTFEMPQGVDVSTLSEDEKMDGEYRYWSYMESHPAHAVLSPKAHAEAMDALRWSYTECLLPSRKSVPQLFSLQECQELMGLLRSTGEDYLSPSIVQTRIVSRVLLRKAQWRQQCFRPDKPLPGDASRTAPGRRRGVGRIILDVIISILCLGIPYLFIGRSSRRVDEEGGMRSHGPLLAVGACACLMAAVILSASVTLLTLPGLDDISRLAGMVAILFSASSMVSAVVALFKYKAEVERSVVYIGGEGLMVLSRRSIVMSLPVVFLAWGIAAFVTGITFYSFRGMTLTSKVIIRQPFSDSTHWAVVGGLGGAAGILLMSIILCG